jgi:outer membrane beta-barrel protein
MGIFKNWVTIGCLLGSLSLGAHAQDSAGPEEPPVTGQDPEIQSVESVLERNVPEGAPKVQLSNKLQKPQSTIDYSQLKSDRNLSDTVVIQKTYMPKSNRVQLFGGFTYATNDVFFRTIGAQLRAGYHFNETWGLELTSFFLTSQDTAEKKDLAGKQRLGVENLTTPQSMYGLNVYFSTIYGKLALEDRKIIPFEFYQTIGVGQVNTKPSSTGSSIYFGLGDLFSISKNSAIRADLSWFFYNSKTINGDTQSANTIFLTIGYGRFVPEARSR